MSDPTSRRTPTSFPSARDLRPRAELPPAQGFPWFDATVPLIVDGEVLAEQRIPSQRHRP
ncbi:hypothetical protein [Saccharopolyspora griseoalba]|uniref:Uncharacterized protein n=1 Tax=Saccharopolyspora griseoalba TaxID=1431848 RepID=A0ABW2LH09_9PSEU